MRSSLGEIYGMRRLGAASGSGGLGGGAGIARTVRRAMRGTGVSGLQEPLHSSSSSTHTQKSSKKTNAIFLSSSSSSNTNNFPITDFAREFDQWEYVDDFENDCVAPVFGAVPSSDEVERALLSLQMGIRPISTSRLTNLEATSDLDLDALNELENEASMGLDLDWIEPSMQIYNADRVHDAFHLLQTEPCVQRMVKSLASDKAVWEAVLKNEVVREIRDSYSNAEPDPRNSEENSDHTDTHPNVLKWIFDNMKEKLLQVIEIITQILGQVSKLPDQDKTEDSNTFSDNVKSAFLLTIVVLLIVVVARVHNA